MTDEQNLPANAGDQASGLILTLRSTPVLIDADLATLYGVTTKALNQAVQRNAERFPQGFKFQLSREEKNELVTNCDRFKKLKYSSALPYAFTEQGVAMLSAVLRSTTAIQTSISIMNAFVAMRQVIQTNGGLLQRIDALEYQYLTLATDTNTKFEKFSVNWRIKIPESRCKASFLMGKYLTRIDSSASFCGRPSNLLC
jgi:hypothetical protein